MSQSLLQQFRDRGLLRLSCVRNLSSRVVLAAGLIALAAVTSTVHAQSAGSLTPRGETTISGATDAAAGNAVPGRGNTAEATLADAPRSVPDFIFTLMDDSTRAVSNDALRGKVYLVDFWATWCPPCVAELPLLERLHKKWAAAGFEIVSLSFDSSPERVRQFRAKHFPMRWLHGHVAAGFSDVLCTVFGVQNIPHLILVGRDGRILTESDTLHGDELEQAVETAMR